MRVVIAGGHGQIAMLLHPLLRTRGHDVLGLIRNPGHADEVRHAGAEPVLCDLEAEQDVTSFVSSADAIVFAAGAGPGSGAARKLTMDRDGAIKLIEAARSTGIKRYVMISAMNAEEPRGDEVFQTYLRAKAEADQVLRNSGLDYTIVRPGRLTNEPGVGLVSVGARLPRGEIPHADVAAVIAYALDTPATIGCQFDVTSGQQDIAEAVTSVGSLNGEPGETSNDPSLQAQFDEVKRNAGITADIHFCTTEMNYKKRKVTEEQAAKGFLTALWDALTVSARKVNV